MLHNGTFHFLTASPYGRQPLTQGLSEYFSEEANKILNPLDAKFKGSDNKTLGCQNLTFHRGWGGGVRLKSGMSQCSYSQFGLCSRMEGTFKDVIDNLYKLIEISKYIFIG